jgi:dienelactone hydrolase
MSVHAKIAEVRGPEHGAPIILMHELPGLTQFCLDLADRLAQQGFRVYLPLLVGQVGQRSMVGNPLRLCMRREFWRLALAVDGHDDAPTTTALRALCRDIAGRHPAHAGVGVIGMCLTGGFALAMLVDPRDKVLAAVASQPSMPLGLGKVRRQALGLGTLAQAALRQRLEAPCGAGLMALRFANDRLCPPRRFDSLRSLLKGVAEDRFICVELPSGTAGVPATAHSVLTEAYAPWPGHPTREAFDAVVAFLASRLQATGGGASAAQPRSG